MHLPSSVNVWHIPEKEVEPIPPAALFLPAPLEEQETSYLADKQQLKLKIFP